MQRYALEAIPPGAVVAASLFNPAGGLLLKAGVTIAAPYVHLIEAHDYVRLVVLSDGQELHPELISPDVRVALTDAVVEAARFLARVEISRDPIVAGDGRWRDLAIQKQIAPFIADVHDNERLRYPEHLRVGPDRWLDDAINGAAVAVHIGRAFNINGVALGRLTYGMLLRDVMLQDLPHPVGRPLSHTASDVARRIRGHPAAIYNVLTALDWGQELGRLVLLQHHERHDGSGYPHALRGLHTLGRDLRASVDVDVTHELSDVAAVAAAFVSLLNGHPDHSPFRPSEVRAVLHQMAGVSLNQLVVDALLDCWDAPDENGASTPGRLLDRLRNQGAADPAGVPWPVAANGATEIDAAQLSAYH